MEETRMIENEYVPRELFDIHLRSLREKTDSDKEISDEKFDKLQMILEKNLAEYKIMITEVHGRIDVLNEKIDHVSDTLNEKIEHTNDTFSVAIMDLHKRIDDLHQSQTLWFAVFGILATVVPIAVAVVQHFIK